MLRFKRGIEEISGKSNSEILQENNQFIKTKTYNNNNNNNSDNNDNKVKITNGSGIDFVASSSGPKIGTITGFEESEKKTVKEKVKNDDAIDIDIDIDNLSE
ncbi:unnamed protein product [[Candida] boidinii]|uniref:Unnamed protein product n=1 Tax=Candida boidinii TaxID=5477 RepID=A0ACB5UAF8_CANBO|nr:unnamed protein product [[Candida] boidinii]